MRPIIMICGFICCSCSLGVIAGDYGDKATTAIAQSWVGHDASELLTQWPVDSGFNTSEIPKDDETAYSYSFGIRAHTKTYNVSDGIEAVGSDSKGNVIVAEKSHVEKEYVPQKIECDATFFANAQGIITHYEYNGTNCRPNFRHWGAPKSSR